MRQRLPRPTTCLQWAATQTGSSAFHPGFQDGKGSQHRRARRVSRAAIGRGGPHASGRRALTTDFTTLAEDLASHGYAVVGFDAPYRTGMVVLPDGRVVRRSPAADLDASPQSDQKLVISLASSRTCGTATRSLWWIGLHGSTRNPPAGSWGRLDLSHLGMFGHSFGGAQALQF